MAVFWKHIKGTTNAETNDNGFWTLINWSDEKVDADLQENSRTMSWAPEIWCKYGNGSTDDDGAVNLGYIITSSNLHQEIMTPLTLTTVYPNEDSGLTFKGSETSYQGFLKIIPGGWREDNKAPLLKTEYQGVWESTGMFKNIGSFENTGQLINYGNVSIRRHNSQNSTLSIEGSCEAHYFNAISDRRAKENIQPILGSALDIIKQVQVYTFNYKDQQRRTIGLIAQELIDKPLDDVNFVFNPQASGINGDYMSISEGKLVYLLLKAIQEQQEEIDTLKKRLEMLEGN